MASLDTYYSTLVGFFSYSRDDDIGSRGALSGLRDAIQWELSAQLGRSPRNFRIWQDTAAIPVGTDWEQQIKLGVSQSAFFVPIITPRVFRSDNCAFEFERFLERERELGRANLVFPLLYIPVPELQDEAIWRADPVLKIVGTRQYFDWKNLRFSSVDSPDVRARIAEFCNNITNAMREPWESPEEREARAKDRDRQQAEAARAARQERKRRTTEMARVAEDENRRKAAEAEAAKQAEMAKQAEAERQAREAEAARLAEDDRRKAAEIEAARLAELARQHQEAEARAQAAKSAQDARIAAHRAALASDDAGVLRAFCKAYSSGADVEEIKARLRILAPRSVPKLSRTMMALAAALILLLFGGVAAFVLNRPAQQTVQTLVSPPVKTADASPAPSPQPPNLDKWAYCSPNSQQKLDYIGGQAQPAALKLTLTPAQTANFIIRAVAVSPDGKTVITAGDDHLIRVWDAASLKWITQLSGHRDAVYGLAFANDGSLLASASFDGTVQIWDGHSFAHVATFDTAQFGGMTKVQQYGVAFEPVNAPQYVDSVGADGTVWIWDLHSRQLAKNPRSSGSTAEPAVGSLSFAPGNSGAFVTSNFDGTVKFFDPSRADAITAFPGRALRVAYSPDGKYVASAGVDDAANQTVRLWNAADRTLFKALPGQIHSAVSLAWSGDGKRLLSGGGYKDMTVRLRDVQSGATLQKFTGHTADVEAVAFHPNQKWVLSAGEDATMKVWDVVSGKLLLNVAGFDNGQYIAYAPNGCYTGSANAANYVKYVTKDTQGHEHDTGDNGQNTLFVPGDSTALLLPQ